MRRVPQRDRRRGGGSSSGHCGRDGDATTAARLAITKVNLAGSLAGGTIAAAVGAMGDLEYLVLGFNNLSGSVPAAVGTLPKLSVLWLSDNHLGGALPHLPYARLHTSCDCDMDGNNFSCPVSSGAKQHCKVYHCSNASAVNR